MRLPPGPRTAGAIQTFGWWARPISFLERCRARYGKRFTIRLLGDAAVRDALRPGRDQGSSSRPRPRSCTPARARGSSSRSSASNSVILLDERDHLEQRKLMLPAFHGERMERLTGLMAEVAEREAAALAARRAGRAPPPPPGADARDDPASGLRARRGRAPRRAARRASPRSSHFGERPASAMLPPSSVNLGGLTGRGRGSCACATRPTTLIFELIDERRGRRRRASATTCSRCCSRPATRTARRCRRRSCATS